MMHVGKIIIYLAGGLTLSTGLCADVAVSPGNPYALIAARNVFGLNPPPSPISPFIANPPPKITPNGIMSLFGQLQVLFKVTGVATSGKAVENQSYILAEGEQQDGIKVVKIDEKADIITFDNHGDIQELPLVNVTSTSAKSTPVATMNPNPANGFAANGYNGANQSGGQYGNRGGNFGGSNEPENGGNNFNNSANNGPGLQNIPMRGDDSNQQLAMTSDEQTALEGQPDMIEVQRLHRQQLEALQEESH